MNQTVSIVIKPPDVMDITIFDTVTQRLWPSDMYSVYILNERNISRLTPCCQSQTATMNAAIIDKHYR